MPFSTRRSSTRGTPRGLFGNRGAVGQQAPPRPNMRPGPGPERAPAVEAGEPVRGGERGDVTHLRRLHRPGEFPNLAGVVVRMVLAHDIDIGAELTAVFANPRLLHEASALKRLSPTVFKPGEVYEVVPTGLAIAGGRVFVALFGGFPYVEQGGAVVSLPMAGAIIRLAKVAQ